jgi:hypothetical protein
MKRGVPDGANEELGTRARRLITKVTKVRTVVPIFPVICQHPSAGKYTLLA